MGALSGRRTSQFVLMRKTRTLRFVSVNCTRKFLVFNNMNRPSGASTSDLPDGQVPACAVGDIRQTFARRDFPLMLSNDHRVGDCRLTDSHDFEKVFIPVSTPQWSNIVAPLARLGALCSCGGLFLFCLPEFRGLCQERVSHCTFATRRHIYRIV